MTPHEISVLAVERIYLIADAEFGCIWSDDPAPDVNHDPADAVEYVRKDVHDARIAELNRERDAALEREQAMGAHVDRIVELLDGTIESNLDTAPEYDREVSKWLADSPTTSLSHRDLIKQAEALEKLYDDTARHVVINRGAVIDIARSLREQAD